MESPQVVTLNVGGRVFQTRRDTLKRMAMLDRMLDFPGEAVAHGDAIFLDRDPTNFEILLGLARGWPLSALQCLSPFQQRTLRADADYLQMDAFPRSVNYTFRLAQTNAWATITNGGSVYAMGAEKKENVVLGDTAVPSSGRTYWEVVVHEPTANGAYLGFGVAAPDITPEKVLSQSGGWGLRQYSGSMGVVENGNAKDLDLPSFTAGMVVGVDLDMDRGSLSFWLGKKLLVTATTGLKCRTVYPALCIQAKGLLEVRPGLQPPDLL